MKVNFEKKKELDFKTNEAYKTLRTNISFSGDDIHVIAFTSSVPNEGKSAVSFNLASSLAEDGKNVLYIDADIRKSVTIARYGVDIETKGLSHYLSGQCKLEEVIYETNIDKFSIIFTGQIAPNPSELLGSDRFKKLVATQREAFDYIIIDCPPLGSVIDAAIVAKECDGAVIVIETDNASYKIVQRVKKQLEQSGCRILGAVLNKVEMGGKGYYGKGYYGNYYGRYYGNYGDYGNEKEA
ncbi:MAG: CpsD/CapB family tyrosine-protein kinase [Lachnospiraceae bacterium]|nr:CpsD/CapB family tyrosine-protein kinase [Lachnospiraceae bacterium]MDE6625920.1 CpsD/CapB family tyrosine-protein kinase [Lachnospiraceae bacterium]